MTAFVLGIVGCIPLASVVAIVVGLVALVRERAGRAFAITGLVLGVLWTAGFGIAIATDAPSRIVEGTGSFFDDFMAWSPDDFDSALTAGLSVGDCFDDPMVDEFVDADREITVVPCDERHDLEVYETFELQEYTTAEDLLYSTEDTCFEAFEEFVGMDYYASELMVYTYFPTQASWDEGIRTVTCTVGDWRPIAGTLKDANR